MERRETKRARLKKGSLRVQSWIYAVLNPLEGGIIREKGFLDSGNLTWRYFTQDFEFLLPAAGYVGPGSRNTYEDFRRAHPKQRPAIDRHDRLLDNLRKVARDAYETLYADKEFVDLAKRRLAEYESAEPDRGFPAGASPREEFPRHAAERVVNNIQELPHYYTDAVFWGRYGEELARFRTGATFRELDLARASLSRYDGTLSKRLKDMKFRLCERYDLPADPLPYMSQVAEGPSYF